MHPPTTIKCTKCGEPFETVRPDKARYCPPCRILMNRLRSIDVGKRKKGGTYEPKGKQGTHQNHYPWEKWTTCICDVCAMLNMPSKHLKKIDWKGRGIPHIRCERHAEEVKHGFITEQPDSYKVFTGRDK